MSERDRQPGIRPRQTLMRRLDAAARRACPVAACLLAVLMLDAPLQLPGSRELLSGLLLASVFFWSVFRPSSMPAIAVFLIGLFSDLLAGAAPGVTALLLLGVHGVARRRFGALARTGFAALWWTFSLVAVAACLLQWSLVSLLRLQVMLPAPALFEAALACALYPPLSAVLIRAHRGIADPSLA